MRSAEQNVGAANEMGRAPRSLSGGESVRRNLECEEDLLPRRLRGWLFALLLRMRGFEGGEMEKISIAREMRFDKDLAAAESGCT